MFTLCTSTEIFLYLTNKLYLKIVVSSGRVVTVQYLRSKELSNLL